VQKREGLYDSRQPDKEVLLLVPPDLAFSRLAAVGLWIPFVGAWSCSLTARDETVNSDVRTIQRCLVKVSCDRVHFWRASVTGLRYTFVLRPNPCDKFHPSMLLFPIVESCVNCRCRSPKDVCAYCAQLTQCRHCHRRLPPACFTTCNRTTCRGCAKRSTKPRVCRSVGDVITEIEIPTTPQDVTFDSFLTRNADQIQQLVEEYRQQFSYFDENI